MNEHLGGECGGKRFFGVDVLERFFVLNSWSSLRRDVFVVDTGGGWIFAVDVVERIFVLNVGSPR